MPPLLTNEYDKKLWDWNDASYAYLIKSLLEFIGRDSSHLPQFILYGWVEIRDPVDRFMSRIFAESYVGDEEGLPEISCWEPGEKNTDIRYLHFDRDRIWQLSYAHEFANSFATLSEDVNRKYVLNIRDGIFRDANGNKVQGYGKFVLKANGCIYWRQYTENFHHVALSKGKRIVAGGWLLFDDGALICANRATGHYQAKVENAQFITSYLKRRGITFPSGIDINSIKVVSCCPSIISHKIKFGPVPGEPSCQ